MSVRLRLLGAFEVLHGTGLQRTRFDRPNSLLVYLACRRDWVSRSELAFLYRPEEPEPKALAYLRKLVFRAHRLPWSAGLEVGRDGLRWLVETDLRRFTEAYERGDWGQALELYGGPFLDGTALAGLPGLSAWQEVERRNQESRWLTCAISCAGELEREGRYLDASAWLEKVLERDPFDEESLQAYLRVLARTGRRGEALRAFAEFRENLDRELGALPLEATEAIADSIRKSASSTGARTSDGRVGIPPLPAPTTPLVGRRAELERLAGLLTSGSARLITIVGLGGTGKTRLGLEAARSHGALFRDGAAFLSLAETHSVDRVPQALLEGLSIPWEGEDPESSLLSALRGRQLLLVVDDFEGVVEAAPLLVRILERAPEIKMLVTSREALAVRGEWLLDLAGLEPPPSVDEPDLERYDSVRLFVSQAARVAPDFTPTRSTLEAIADICRRLEGLPLAIELAASWTRTLSCERLRDDLERNAQLLTSARRDIPERHRSLWAAFDHTWSRLGSDEKAALERLAVFRGGFTLEAAERVAGADLNLLLGLMNRTLVRRRQADRYQMHQLVRQYALDRFDVAEAEAAHASYFAEMLERLTPDLKGADPLGALARLQADIENVEAAWDHAVRGADVGLLESCRDALDHYYHYRSRWGAAAAAFYGALRALECRTRDLAGERLYGRLLVHLALYERARGDLERARNLASRGLDRLTVAGSAEGVAYARLELGTSATLAADYREAESQLREVLAAGRRLSDAYLQGAALNGLANLEVYTNGDVATAERYYRESLAAHRAVGSLEGINGALINLGACRYDLHDFEEAERLWREAAAMASELGYTQREGVLHNNLGSLAESSGDTAAAREHYLESLALRSDIGDRSGVANVLHNLGRLAHGQGDFDDARSNLQEALEIYVSLQERAAIAYTRSSLARSLARLGRIGQAEEEARGALELAHAIGSRGDMLAALLARCEISELQGRFEESMRLAAVVSREAADNEESYRQRANGSLERLTPCLPGATVEELFSAGRHSSLAEVVEMELSSGR